MMTLDSCNNLEVDRNLKSKRTIKSQQDADRVSPDKGTKARQGRDAQAVVQ